MNGHRWPLTTRWMFDLTFAGDLLLGTTASRTSNDRTLLAWDLTAHAPKWEVPIPAQASLRVSHDGTWVATWDQEALRCWDLPTGQLLRQCQQRMFVVAALPGDVLLCLGNGSLFALSVRTGQVEKLCFLGETHEVAVNAAGTRLACVLSRKTLAIFDLHARAKVAEAPAPPRDRVVFRPGDAELVLPDAPGGPAIADAQTGVTVAVLKGAPTQGYPQCAISCDGRWLVTAHGDQPDNHAPWDDLCLRVWDLTARTLHRTHAVPDLPSALRISDGAVVEAASADDRLTWSKYEG